MCEELKLLFALKGKAYKGRIEEWKTEKILSSSLRVMTGKLHDKPHRDSRRISDIRTSEITMIYKECKFLETRNSYYVLGNKYSK